MAAWIRSGSVNSYRITFSDGSDPIEVRNNVGDVIAWERANKRSWQGSLDNQAMLWVAWKAARRLELTSEPTFDQFLARVEDYEIEDPDGGAEDGDPEGPTQPDPSES